MKKLSLYMLLASLAFVPVGTFATSYDCGVGSTLYVSHTESNITDLLIVDGYTFRDAAGTKQEFTIDDCTGVHSITDTDNEAVVLIFTHSTALSILQNADLFPIFNKIVVVLFYYFCILGSLVFGLVYGFRFFNQKK